MPKPHQEIFERIRRGETITVEEANLLIKDLNVIFNDTLLQLNLAFRNISDQMAKVIGATAILVKAIEQSQELEDDGIDCPNCTPYDRNDCPDPQGH